MMLINSVLEQWMKDNVAFLVFVIICAVLIVLGIAGLIITSILSKKNKGLDEKQTPKKETK